MSYKKPTQYNKAIDNLTVSDMLSLGNDEFKFPDADKQRGGIGDGSVGWTSETFQILEVGQSVGNFYGYKYAGKDKDGNFYGYTKDGKKRKFSHKRKRICNDSGLQWFGI